MHLARVLRNRNWRRRRESNPPKSDRQSGALPRGLQRHYMVDAVGFEPTCSYERIYSPSPSASRSHVQFVNTLSAMRFDARQRSERECVY